MHEDMLKAMNMKQQSDTARGYQGNCDVQAQTVGLAGAPRSYTLADEAAKRVASHADFHNKAAAAYEFLTKHPEFDEFVRLVRAGSIQI